MTQYKFKINTLTKLKDKWKISTENKEYFVIDLQEPPDVFVTPFKLTNIQELKEEQELYAIVEDNIIKQVRLLDNTTQQPTYNFNLKEDVISDTIHSPETWTKISQKVWY